MSHELHVIGRLGTDPEPVASAGEGARASFRLASAERGGHTEWFTVVVRDRLAEVCLQYLHSGRLVSVRGHLRTRQPQSGSAREPLYVAREVEFIDPPNKAARRAAAGAP